MVGTVSLNYYAILTLYFITCILYYIMLYYTILYTPRLLWRFLHFVTDLLNPLLARYHRLAHTTTSATTAAATSTTGTVRVGRGAIS